MSSPRAEPAPLPRPTALRLVSRTEGAKTKPPLGVSSWTDDPNAAVALLLARSAGAVGMTVEEVARQLPLPTTLAPGTLVLVLGVLAPNRSGIGRWLEPTIRIPRYLRGSALLAAGYARLGGGTDPLGGGDLAWGYAPG